MSIYPIVLQSILTRNVRPSFRIQQCRFVQRDIKKRWLCSVMTGYSGDLDIDGLSWHSTTISELVVCHRCHVGLLRHVKTLRQCKMK